MLMKTAVTALLGLTMVADAATLHHYGSPSALARRQNRGNRFGGGFGGNNGGNNGQNGGQNNNGQNGGQNNNGQNGGDQNNGQNGGQNNGDNNNNNGGGNNNNNGGTATCLAANALQTGSQSTGQNGGQVEAGQVESATDDANFINFCAGETLTNGQQNRDGSCNGIPMGKIPAANKMVSTVILNPQNGDDLAEGQTFNIEVKIANMELGSFTNAQETYYSAPQDLNGQGLVIGHTHVTVQDTGNTLNPTQPLDASQFAFFKGINDAGDGQGTLAAEVTGGLPAGCYRVCTMSGASNHQPVLMPVAQRGSQEDCRYFSVGGACGNGNNGNNNNNNNNGGNNNGQNNNGQNNDQNNGGQNNNGQNNNGQNGGDQNNGQNGGDQNNGGQDNNGQNGGQNGGDQNNGQNGNAASGSAIAGAEAPAVEETNDPQRPFSVNGNSFATKEAAVQRACAIQNNACADAVNGGNAQGVTIEQCNQQEAACRAAGGA
ncbi:ribosomal protein s17 [Corynascus novoguineensis]|uniref:Ribosomal protein s17 n=1 Tax=Corynascus novoguineensis TaxID=1126955 RepID=A0AAN7CZ92_9PEZI|nr:ribosomal protein s17 [Corynascus novoguineensis]